LSRSAPRRQSAKRSIGRVCAFGRGPPVPCPPGLADRSLGPAVVWRGPWADGQEPSAAAQWLRSVLLAVAPIAGDRLRSLRCQRLCSSSLAMVVGNPHGHHARQWALFAASPQRADPLLDPRTRCRQLWRNTMRQHVAARCVAVFRWRKGGLSRTDAASRKRPALAA
jgi:hypothetical protein